MGELVLYVPPSVPDRSGRRTSYTFDIGLEICLRMSTGETLKRICRDPQMPDFRTVMNWLHYAKDVTPALKEFRKMEIRARQAQMIAWSDEIIEIADDGSNDWYEAELESGRIETRFNHEHVARSKVRIDTRLRLMGTVARQRFGTTKEAMVGERMNGDMPDAPSAPQMSATEKARRIAFIMGQAGEREPVKAAASATANAAPEPSQAAQAPIEEVDEEWFGEE